jgi:gliding motility-associated-like protein
MTRFFLLISILFFSFQSKAQDKSNKGKEFWLGYGHNVLFGNSSGIGNPSNSQNLVIYLSAEQAATVTVSVNGTGFSQTVTVPANTVDASIIIPKTGTDDARLMAEGKSAKGIHIVSDVPIVAYAHQYGLFSSAATMLMPVETFGYTYYSLNYHQVTNIPTSYSWFFVVAAEDNTRLQITPSDTTQAGWLPNQNYTVDLQKGEIYNVFGKSNSGNAYGKDMSGSKIVSVAGADNTCHPVGMFSGSSRNVLLGPDCNGAPPYQGQANGNGGEVLMQQIFPANAWGTRYLTYHTVTNLGANPAPPFLNLYRVAVRNPGTIVKRNGVVLTGLKKNFYYEFASNSGDYIEADQPVLVSQYMVSTNECVNYNDGPIGDPEMMYLSPIEQGVTSARFYATRKEAIDLNFVNIIVPLAAVATLRINGNAVLPSEYITHPNNSQYAVVVKRFTGAAAQHSITCDASFIATIYGLGTTESYGYNVGTLVNNLDALSAIQNVYNTNGIADTFTCPKTPVKLLAKTAFRATSIRWLLSQLNGISPSADSLINNPLPIDSNLVNGRKYYTYTLAQDFIFTASGTYYVPVVYTSPDIDKCGQTDTAWVKVIVKPGPVTDFTFNPVLCVKDTVFFSGAALPGSFNINRYLWTFDDGTTATTKDAKKLYTTAVNHDVQYKVFADNGCIGDTIKTATIFNPPVASFTVAGLPCVDSVLRFTPNSMATGGTLQSWYWDFGNGQTLTTNNNNPVSAMYTAAGNITVKHVAGISSTCKSDTAFLQPVMIHANPVAGFSIIGDTLCPNMPLQFISLEASADSIVNHRWSFGDGSFSSADTVSKAFSQTGLYNVQLVTKDKFGCGSLPTTKPLTIYKNPVVNAGPSFTVFSGAVVQFSPSVNDTLQVRFRWTPATGLSDANILRPVLQVFQTQAYKLTASGPGNCTASDTMQVKLLSTLKIINAFSPNGDGINDVWILPGLEDYLQATVQIFDRYGKVVHSTTGFPKPWDGKQNGKPLPVGTYFYIIDTKTDFVKPFAGAVTILK